jgi:hypothetical protein
VFLKATGLNILRAAAFRAKTDKISRKQTNSETGDHFPLDCAVIKEHLAAICRLFGVLAKNPLQNGMADDSYSLRTAA